MTTHALREAGRRNAYRLLTHARPLPTVPVLAECLREDHLLVVDDTVAEIVRVVDGREWGDGPVITVEWVPAGAAFDAPVRTAVYPLDALVPCVRRADWREMTA